MALVNHDHLEPEDSPFVPRGVLSRYNEAVVELLQAVRPSRYALVSVVCLPSFECEWSLWLFGSRFDEHRLELRVADVPIWPCEGDLPTVTRREAPVAADVAQGIVDVWTWMLRRVRHPDEPGMGLDGVTYHFTTNARGAGMAGQIWSPEANTAPGRLVALSEALRRFVESGGARTGAMANDVRKTLTYLHALEP